LLPISGDVLVKAAHRVDAQQVVAGRGPSATPVFQSVAMP
jgi:hypothetical protein